jgi:hypothetical protein
MMHLAQREEHLAQMAQEAKVEEQRLEYLAQMAKEAKEAQIPPASPTSFTTTSPTEDDQAHHEDQPLQKRGRVVSATSTPRTKAKSAKSTSPRRKASPRTPPPEVKRRLSKTASAGADPVFDHPLRDRADDAEAVSWIGTQFKTGQHGFRVAANPLYAALAAELREGDEGNTGVALATEPRGGDDDEVIVTGHTKNVQRFTIDDDDGVTDPTPAPTTQPAKISGSTAEQAKPKQAPLHESAATQ